MPDAHAKNKEIAMPTYLSPKSDITFKKVFGNEHHKIVTISFLNSILNLKDDKRITEISFVDTANVREAMSLKDTFIDVHCVDGIGNHFLIEMQVDSQAWFIQRALYYLSLVFARQLPYGINYHKLVPVICITILNHIKFPEHNNVMSHYVFIEKNSLQLLPEQYLELYFIELPKFTKTEDQLETEIDEWLFFMTSAQDVQAVPQKMKKSKEFQEAFHVLDKMKWTEAEFFAYLAQLDKADKPRRIAEAARQEGELKGKIEGKIEGRIEGELQGELKKAEAVALHGLQKGLDLSLIQELTGLSIEQLEALRKKI